MQVTFNWPLMMISMASILFHFIPISAVARIWQLELQTTASLMQSQEAIHNQQYT